MLPIISHPSANHDARDGQVVDMLVLHYTGMKSGADALARMCDPTAKVSAHYLVEEDGRVFQLVPENCRAWHAGVSSWRGHTNINQRSIGVEIVNPGHEYGYRPFPQAQMQSVIGLCKEILARHPIPARNVVAHSDVAPMRKEDPGELFDWAWLAREGVGLWPAAGCLLPDSEKVAFDLLSVGGQLAAYGYDIADLTKTIIAFQRHFRPAALTGEWDAECEQLLAELLKKV